MANSPSLAVSISNFDETLYLESCPQAKEAIEAGEATSALDHYLRVAVDEDIFAPVRRDPTSLTAVLERFVVSESGFCLLVGWVADEGCDPPRYQLLGSELEVEFSAEAIFRYARADVESRFRRGAYDYGFVAFGRTPSKSLLKQSLVFQISAVAGSFQTRATPEIVSDKRILDALLETVATCQSHAGKEPVLNAFLGGAAGRSLIELFQSNVANSVSGHYVERFQTRRVSHSFVTVLFGSVEPMMIQPVLFRTSKVDLGEWIYVCNSPEDAEAVLRQARLISGLYDVMITAIIMGDNAGFGAANNTAVGHAASDRVFLINPDVYPLRDSVAKLQGVLTNEDLGATLWGGLLFYDDCNLMHSGLYIERDAFVRRSSLKRLEPSSGSSRVCGLLRVEHCDKGVPFEPSRWQKRRDVPAVSGAAMAFERKYFERLGGFSTKYVYAHYEDVDLSLRWRRNIGSVAVHPFLRFVHLEGQGAKTRGEQYRGASMVNRHIFTLEHGGELVEQDMRIS
jgi:GT2 family glycosyltransferase